MLKKMSKVLVGAGRTFAGSLLECFLFLYKLYTRRSFQRIRKFYNVLSARVVEIVQKSLTFVCELLNYVMFVMVTNLVEQVVQRFMFQAKDLAMYGPPKLQQL